ncbi:MAG: thiamine pyrophosphate-binding protein, partial [bacterium]
MKVTTYIARFLKQKGVNIVFELQGGMITRIIDAIHHEGGIKIVSMHHEQAAAMAADAYGRITNKPGIALATSGPGATNLLTGIGNCYFDSVAAIFITGQVNLNEQKGDRPTRQIGFQETDIVSMAKPVTN